MRDYKYMLIRKITGIPTSRHETRESAIKALRRWQWHDADPIELREYSPVYWEQMR